MRIALALVVVVLALAGCDSDPGEPEPAPTPTIAEPSASPDPTAPAILELHPDVFATQLDFRGPGIDFDSVDGNIHCGIWERMDVYRYEGGAPVKGVRAGCRPAESTYKTDPSMDSSGEIACNGGELAADFPVQPVCGSGQEFVGENPEEGPVGTLPQGSSLTYAGVTCIAPDEGTIECVRETDGAGFTIGRDAYRYF